MEELPTVLETTLNEPVLKHVPPLSAHSDLVEALLGAVGPLGDVSSYCPDPAAYRAVLVFTKDVIFGFAVGMKTIVFRLDEPMRARALATGGELYPACGKEWVAFTLFRPDWPNVDLKFWALRAYVHAREDGGDSSGTR